MTFDTHTFLSYGTWPTADASEDGWVSRVKFLECHLSAGIGEAARIRHERLAGNGVFSKDGSMQEYLDRARAALAAFQAALAAFDGERGQIAASAALPPRRVEKLDEITARIRAAAARLEHSLSQIAGENALDVVDLQVRMEGEGAGLASALKALGELIESTPALQSDARIELVALDEAAERIASALFPNAIEGVRDINSTLWQFRPIWRDYVDILRREVARPGGKGLTADQIARIESTATEVRARFDAVNEVLNQLAVGRATDGTAVQSLVREARQSLAAAIRDAKSKAADAYKPFHGVLKRAEALARKIDDQFADLRVPVFPAPSDGGELASLLEPSRYEELAGVERFALLNISARLRSIPLADGNDGHLLSPYFRVRVFDVFPDRIYFTADAAFLTAVEALADAGVFEKAPASLHRFRAGSFKQRQSRKGNLQVSYAFGSPEAPDDRQAICVDADIDLYRSPVRHLFGEVLVNHLTGSKTDQFRVWDILASNSVPPLGGFAVVSV